MDVVRYAESPVGRLVPISGIDGRTMAPYRHFAFVPDPLDAEPHMSDTTWRQIARAGYALGRLHQAGRQVPTPALLRSPTLRREAQSTSALEGTYAPLTDVLAADLVQDDPRSEQLGEVLNYVWAAEAAFSALAEGRTLSVSLLRELHQLLVRGTPADDDQAGRIRGIQVVIGSPSEALMDARFIPPPPGAGLEAALADLLLWMRPPTPRRDPVVAAAIAHYQFEALHPFNDGNGRLGRLMIVLQLMQDGMIAEPLLSVSPWFERRRAQYQDRLAEVSASGDWDGWVTFFAEGLEASAIDTAIRVDQLLAVHADYLDRIRETRITGLARDLGETLVGAPYVTVSTLARRSGKSFQAANTAVLRLVELGILREISGRSYDRMFEAADVVSVLTAPSR